MSQDSGTIAGRPISEAQLSDVNAMHRWYEDMHEAIINMVPTGSQRDQAVLRLTESEMWAEKSILDGNPFAK